MESAKTVLIIGGSGFIGSHLALRLRNEYKVFATYHSNPIQIPGVTCLPLDLKDPDWTKRIIYTASPDIVVYAAGSNSIADAESNSKRTESAHVGYLGPVLKAATIFQPKFVYLSNCYVFDGSRGNYRETDTILAGSSLGKLKVSGENFVRGRALNYSILRLSPVYGRGNGRNLSFLDDLRMSLGRGKKVSVAENEIHSFVPISSTIDVIVRTIQVGPRNRTFHFGGTTKCSHLDFARAYARRFKLDPALIIPPTTATGPTFDFSLNSTDAIRTLGAKPLLLEEGLDELDRSIQRRSSPDAAEASV